MLYEYRHFNIHRYICDNRNSEYAGIEINCAGGALLDAVSMFFNVLSLKGAYAVIDLDIILFIPGMVIIIAYIELSNFLKFLKDGY